MNLKVNLVSMQTKIIIYFNNYLIIWLHGQSLPLSFISAIVFKHHIIAAITTGNRLYFYITDNVINWLFISLLTQ